MVLKPFPNTLGVCAYFALIYILNLLHKKKWVDYITKTAWQPNCNEQEKEYAPNVVNPQPYQRNPQLNFENPSTTDPQVILLTSFNSPQEY